ncbi:LiaF transmembrane domain-containing protein [Albibacterium bauzanense]|uniref:Cell wall-active antibiotic response 4TMS protein YvqF n=1 Tax=Albibacterium bauzanense TaxID=653929 RepID=A0A4R1M0N5_9SPHI|nr:LiaF domain-containing protein [Albibacterium bauzanense]TCK85468.1 cell wall-active antibiotic response 4TMS protein YvqF [Albibacterium bauzanense]
MKRRNQSIQGSRSGRNFIGLIIILIGGLLLIDRLIPALSLGWLFSWPMVLIVVGLFIGAKSQFENVASYILIILGGFFLLNNYFDFRLGPLLWPIILIFLGFWLIKGRSQRFRSGIPPVPPVPPTPDDFVWDRRVKDENDVENEVPPKTPPSTDESELKDEGDWSKNNAYNKENTENYKENKDDYIDSTSIFGDAKHYVVSQQFKGGDVVNIMGGATINLMRADLKGPATLEVVQLFGGTTIITPSHWVIQPEMASIFGGIEDKRFHTHSAPDRTKVLYIKGTSIFGGITIKSI